LEILLIEDNPADARLVREALAEGDVRADLRWLASGEDALNYLRRTGPYAGTQTTPDLVLLDLNLPGLHGQEVLTAIKTDPALLRLPVVVLTSSANPVDVHAVLGRHANAYFVKPQSYTDFLELVGYILRHWRHAALSPGPVGMPTPGKR
jgi:chemotaxis family two-component system response regulator Rcp1